MTEPRRYLLVDDNVAFAENVAEILRDEGDEVVVSSSGEEAVQLVRSKRFDALVTDMRMPVMSGARLVHAIRRLDPGLPAIVVTAYTTDDDLGSARREGLLAVLPKPVSVPRLLDLLSVARRDGLVALVEDDDQLADNLSEALSDQGFTAVTATSVMETERLGPVSPFAGVVDICVRGGPSGAALEELSRRFPGLPVIAMTGFPDEVPEGLDAAVFLKPFQTDALLKELELLHSRKADGGADTQFSPAPGEGQG